MNISRPMTAFLIASLLGGCRAEDTDATVSGLSEDEIAELLDRVEALEADAAEDDTDAGADNDPAYIDLVHALGGPRSGYFLQYDPEFNVGDGGWISRPTLWVWAEPLGGSAFTAYVWEHNPANGGGLIDRYDGDYDVIGNHALGLEILDTNTGAIDRVELVAAFLDHDGTVFWDWTLNDGTEGMITLTPAEDGSGYEVPDDSQ